MKTLQNALLVLLLALACDLALANQTYTNPILPGYHPDPSIVRVGEDYYMVNSTFEWFPGMPIHHSKDLVNWELIGYGLHSPEQLNLQEGLADYMGIFAVTIRYHDGRFYLITTCVQCERGGNFYVTAKNPAGPWSNPVWLDSPGIDPSLMWDDDGKAYYVGHGNLSGTQAWKDQQGVWLQQLDTTQGKLVGPRKQLTFGHANNAVWTEGPHLYKINGHYLLMVAEGGTGSNHSVTVHHSDNIWGPYIADQINPVLTHRHLGKDYPIHSVGHADIVQTQKGDWWAVMLGKRYVEGATLLARETFLTPVTFEGKTPIFNPGVGKVLLQQQRPNLPWSPIKKKPMRDDFTENTLDLEWNFLRTPHQQWYALDGDNLVLNVRKETLHSLSNPSLVARRIEAHQFTATLSLEFNAASSEQAGLTLYRSSQCHYLFVKEPDALVIIKNLKGERTEIARVPYTKNTVVLQASANGRKLQFKYGTSKRKLKTIGEQQDMATISFETAGGFNGPYVGMLATSNGQASENTAKFNWFDYREK